jgi:simple sugar transport system permease protein
VIDEIVSTAMLAQTLRSSLPYVSAAIGGTISERSGVVNIALEGILLSSSLAGVVAAAWTHSGWIGVLAGLACGAAIGFIHVLLVEWGRVNAIISGVAINLVAAGGTRVVLRVLYASSSNSPAIDVFRHEAEGVSRIVWTVFDPLFVLIAIALALTIVSMDRTRFGLRLRACGEAPRATARAGVDVRRVRLFAVTIGSAICGLGGVALAYDEPQFHSGMSGGRGFIALAAVIAAGWRPGRAAIACIAFAFLDALQIELQARAAALHDVLTMLPYVTTLFVLAVALRRGTGRAPAGLGVSAEEGS